MGSFVAEQMFLPSERLPTLHTVVRSVGLYTHVQFNVSVQVFPTTIRLRATFVGAMK